MNNTTYTEDEAKDIVENIEANQTNESEIIFLEKDYILELGNKLKSVFEEKNSTLEKKAYATNLTEEGLAMSINYFTEKCPWEFGQSIGIVEICKALNAIKFEENKPVYFKGLTIQAICYHFSKYKGIGLESATLFSELLLEPFNNALGLVNTDTEEIKKIGEKLQFLDMQIGALEQGLKVEHSKMIKEIEDIVK